MKKISSLPLLLGALIVCGCTKDNENNTSNDFSIAREQAITVNDVTFKMVYVEGCTFTMGATPELVGDAYYDEKPIHNVTLSNFYIGQTEVTQALWEAVMGNNPSHFKGKNLPVERVCWDDCQEFISKLNRLTGKTFRLPTEAEWEYAARGGAWSQDYRYSGSNDIDSVAWHDENSSNKTHAVGTKTPNELGLFDMSGNVYELCEEWYDDYNRSDQTNPTGPTSVDYSVYRGGSWNLPARNCLVSYRITFSPGGSYSFFGLRLALEP